MKRLCIVLGLLFLVVFAPASSLARSLPFGSIVRQRIAPFPGGGMKPAYQLRAGDPGTAAQKNDLGFDHATEVGPAVKSVLVEVGKDPYAAYRWVRDKVEYEPYFGIKRGGEGCAWDKVGNDFDQAALLASLLRSQGVPVRFVYGVVRFSGDNLADWCGVSTSEEAYRLMVQGGVPIWAETIKKEIMQVEINHCWLEAQVPYTSPGFRGPGEKIWIPLDPSYKKHEVRLGQDLFPHLGFQEEEFLFDYLEAGGDRSPEDAFRDLLREKLQSMKKGPVISQAAYEIAIIPEGDGSLPLALPKDFKVKGIIWEEPAVPESYHYQICLTLMDGRNDDSGVTPGDIRVTLPTAFLSHHFITIAYRPATPADQALADSSPSASPLDPTIRDQIKVKPVMFIDGRLFSEVLSGVFTESAPPPGPLDGLTGGLAEGMAGIDSDPNREETMPPARTGNIGTRQVLRIQTILPAIASSDFSERLENELVVGEAYALGAMVGMVTVKRMQYLTARLQKLKQEGTGSPEEVLSYTLSLATLQYIHRESASTRVLSQLLGVRFLYEPSLMMCGIRLDPASHSFDSNGLFFDIQRYVLAIASRDGRADRERAFMFLSGMQSSYLEHKVLADVFQTSAVSTIRILRRAREIGLKPLILDQTHLSSLAGLSLPPQLKAEIQEHIGKGRRVIIPPASITLERWSGWGYVAWDTRDGCGGFIISGGLAGGNISRSTPGFLVSLWQNAHSHGWYVIWSEWVDPEFQDLERFELVYCYYDPEEEPLIASVVILPELFPLSTIDYTDPDLSGTWTYLPTRFSGDDGRSFSAIALCLDPADPVKIYPYRIVTSQPYDSDSEILVDSITWSVGDRDVTDSNPLVYRTRDFGELNENGQILRLEVETSDGRTYSSYVVLYPPAGATLLKPFGIGANSNNTRYWWPQYIDVMVETQTTTKVLNAVSVELFEEGDTDTPLSLRFIYPSENQPAPLSMTVDGLPEAAAGLPDGHTLDGGWYVLRVRAYTDNFSSIYSGTVRAMVGDDRENDLVVKPPGEVLAPWRVITGLNESAAIYFQNISSELCRVGIAYQEEGDQSGQHVLMGEYGDAPGGGLFSRSWDGMLFDRTMWTSVKAHAGDGTIRILAVDQGGKYTVSSFPVEIDQSEEEIAAISDIDFDPWFIHIRPSSKTIDGIEPFDPVGISFSVNVPGYLALSIVDADNNHVRLLSESIFVTQGLQTVSWDVRDDAGDDDPGYIVPEGTSHLQAYLAPVQASGQILDAGGGSIRVKLDTRQLRDVGKRRGKAFLNGIDLTSGNHFRQVDDISLPINAQGFTWTRYYNSRSNESGPLGVGWRHRYQVRLTPTDGGSMQLTWGHGGGEIFAKTLTGYEPDPESCNTLREIFDTWKVSTPEGDFEFDEMGYLTEGWGLSFDYRDCRENDCGHETGKSLKRLKYISSSNPLVGLSVEIFYDSDGLIERVTASLGNTVTQEVTYDTYEEKQSNAFNILQTG